MEILKGQKMLDFDVVEEDIYANLREVYYSDTLVKGMYMRVVIKDTEKPRITIRKEGATIKVPLAFEQYWVDCVGIAAYWCELYKKNECSCSVRGRYCINTTHDEQNLFINFSAVEKNKILKGKV